MALGEKPGTRAQRAPPSAATRVLRTLALASAAVLAFVLLLSAVTICSLP